MSLPSSLLRWALPIVLSMASSLSFQWYRTVSRNVPEPYLDEFFHVPQAQKYCKGDYTWDPKITTPPGLYIVVKLLRPLIGCDISSLRSLNAGALCGICLLAYNILRKLRFLARTTHGYGKSNREELIYDDSTTLLDANTALNVSLFPPLFFFSALFYTDVMSTLAVLSSYFALLSKSSPRGDLHDILNAILIGVAALFFRQTNIFWVAVFPAGLSVVDAMKTDSASSFSNSGSKDLGALLQQSWKEGVVHDCPVRDAHFEDYLILILSLVLVALRKPALVLRVVFPYLALLILFAGFVAWNGSVVLGDKSAHTATIHTPQMLYIWPYIALFSAPLILEPVFQLLITLLPEHLQTRVTTLGISSSTPRFPGILSSILFLAGAVAAVHFNTIIHPYTLADNRHYVFYVFKIMRRYPAIRYLAAPVYYACAWLAWQCLASTPNSEEALRRGHENAGPTSDEIGCSPCQISFIIVWLIATTFSVVTAPLVEPRYFIIPWTIWRLHVLCRPASFSSRRSSALTGYDVRLGLETIWLLAINAATSYLFIYRGFTWPSEPGKVQRFLW